jgi:hypothetical protein
MKYSLFFATLFLSASTIGFSSDKEPSNKDIYRIKEQIERALGLFPGGKAHFRFVMESFYPEGLHGHNDVQTFCIPNVSDAVRYALKNGITENRSRHKFYGDGFSEKLSMKIKGGSAEERAELDREFSEKYTKLEAAQQEVYKLAHADKMKPVLDELALTANASSGAAAK